MELVPSFMLGGKSMDEHRYIAPSNFKGGRLIFGMYRISDLIIIASGTVLMIVGCIICFNNLSGTALIVGIIIFVFIGGLCWILTTNYSVYHNIMVFLIEYLDYFVSNKDYVFEGIVNYDEEKDERNKEE